MRREQRALDGRHHCGADRLERCNAIALHGNQLERHRTSQIRGKRERYQIAHDAKLLDERRRLHARRTGKAGDTPLQVPDIGEVSVDAGAVGGRKPGLQPSNARQHRVEHAIAGGSFRTKQSREGPPHARFGQDRCRRLMIQVNPHPAKLCHGLAKWKARIESAITKDRRI